jgi:uncharacterized protein
MWFDPAWLIAPPLLYPLWEAAHPRLRDVTLRFPNLPPAWDGLSLLYLSDSHTRRRGRRERRLERLMDGLEADLLLFGGDVAQSDRGFRVMIDAVRGVTARLGRYACWGNSENLRHVSRDAFRRRLEEAGFTPLVNANVVLERGGAPLALCGVDCPYSKKAEFGPAFAGVPEETFRILLMHAPEGLLDLGPRRADLILSGHTHGGQIRLPGLPPFHLHTHTEVDLDRGVFDADALRPFWPEAQPHSRMVVSAGIGTSTAPVRLFCPPEALRITLRCR